MIICLFYWALCLFYINYNTTVETRLLEVDGTRGNTSSYPKFELNIGSLLPIFFPALKLDLQCSSQWFALHTVLVVYIAFTLPFGEGLSIRYTINMIHYLFIAIIIAETQLNFLLSFSFKTSHSCLQKAIKIEQGSRSRQTIHRLNQGIFKAKRKVIYMCTCTFQCN